LSNPEDVPAKLNEAAVMQSTQKLGIEVERWEVRKPDDLERVFAATAGSEAVLVQWLALTSQAAICAVMSGNTTILLVLINST
jgi:hypothetical protein